jgi:hypothetical protein
MLKINDLRVVILVSVLRINDLSLITLFFGVKNALKRGFLA